MAHMRVRVCVCVYLINMMCRPRVVLWGRERHSTPSRARMLRIYASCAAPAFHYYFALLLRCSAQARRVVRRNFY